MDDNKQDQLPANKHGLPEMFRPLLWSYKFEEIDPEAHQREIIINAINYGDLPHWRWLVSHYGLDQVKGILTSVPVTEIRSHVRRLVSLLFSIDDNEYNHAPRGAH